MDFVFLLNALMKKKWVILICTIAGMIGGIVFILAKKNLYLSVAQYSTGFTLKQEVKLKDESGLNIFEIDQRFKNVIETFNSPVVIGMLSYDLMMHDLENKRPFRTLTDKEKESIRNLNLDSVKTLLRRKLNNQELLVAYEESDKKAFDLIKLYRYDNDEILDNLVVDRVQGTDYLDIKYRSENPELSSYVVNAIGIKFYNFFSKITSVRSGESIVKLDSLTSSKKQELEKTIATLKNFRDKIGSPDVGDRAKAAMEMQQSLTTDLNADEGQLNTLNGKLASVKMQLENLGGGSNTTTTATSGSSNAEYINLLNKNRELIKQLTAKGSDPELQSQIDANTKKLQQMSSASGTTTSPSKVDAQQQRQQLIREKTDLEYEIAAMNSTVNGINAKIRAASSVASTGGGDEVVVQSMQYDVDRLNTEYQQLNARLGATQDINIAPEFNFKQTLVGQPAYKPEPGNKKLTLMLSTFSALLISSLIVLILDFLNTSLRAPSVFHKSVKLKLISAINNINLRSNSLSQLFESETGRNLENSGLFVENLRKLRYEIEESGKKIFLFTSTKPGEGKSTIIEALAHSFSLSKHKILLIDSNFYHNTLTEKLEAKPMLEQFNVGDPGSLMNGFREVVSMTSIPNTEIVGCTEGNYSPSEILPKNNLLRNLGAIRDQYDFIFMEGADLNNHADSKELTKYADGIISVFSAQSRITQLDKDSIQFLRSNGDHFVGAILNRVEKENLEL